MQTSDQSNTPNNINNNNNAMTESNATSVWCITQLFQSVNSDDFRTLGNIPKQISNKAYI